MCSRQSFVRFVRLTLSWWIMSSRKTPRLLSPPTHHRLHIGTKPWTGRSRRSPRHPASCHGAPNLPTARRRTAGDRPEAWGHRRPELHPVLDKCTRQPAAAQAHLPTCPPACIRRDHQATVRCQLPDTARPRTRARTLGASPHARLASPACKPQPLALPARRHLLVQGSLLCGGWVPG